MKYLYSIFLLCLLFIIYAMFSPNKASAQDLIISEYIEGSSNNKAIEIYNPTDSPISMTGYKLQSYINGSVTVSAFATSSATIDPGKTFVLCNSGLSVGAINKCDLKISGVGTALTFNGDDALTLNRPDGQIIDSIGQIGIDPGIEWGSGLISTADNTLRKKCNIIQGDAIASDIFDPSGDWDGFSTDTFDGLGTHSTCLSSPNPTLTPSPSPLQTVAPTPTFLPTVTPSPTPTATPTPITTELPTLTPTPTPTPATTPTPSADPTPSPLPTGTPMPTQVPKPNQIKHLMHWLKKYYFFWLKYTQNNHFSHKFIFNK